MSYFIRCMVSSGGRSGQSAGLLLFPLILSRSQFPSPLPSSRTGRAERCYRNIATRGPRGSEQQTPTNLFHCFLNVVYIKLSDTSDRMKKNFCEVKSGQNTFACCDARVKKGRGGETKAGCETRAQKEKASEHGKQGGPTAADGANLSPSWASSVSPPPHFV